MTRDMKEMRSEKQQGTGPWRTLQVTEGARQPEEAWSTGSLRPLQGGQGRNRKTS